MPHARGTFDVTLAPLPPYESTEGALLGRFSLDKTFSGELDATSRGEMLSAGSAVKGSAGYVAIERVVGTLAGQEGTFVLQHNGTMNRGAPSLIVTVVPDSGTGALSSLAGTMSIEIADGVHSYHFAYSLAGTDS
ncbi:MAG: DUF3224 domain-containing protein [Gemmatimonadaceae bacterium]|nr:DUF3224 domain-containing protein [Gemmatimonadaceae bacterium]